MKNVEVLNVQVFSGKRRATRTAPGWAFVFLLDKLPVGVPGRDFNVLLAATGATIPEALSKLKQQARFKFGPESPAVEAVEAQQKAQQEAQIVPWS